MDRRMDRRTVAKGAGALAGAAAMGMLPSAVGASATTPSTPTTPSLYDRLGGFFPIAAVVDRFSDAIIVNPKLNENPTLREWNETQAETRLPGLKFGRTLWMAAAAGGPFVYTGLPLDKAAPALPGEEEGDLAWPRPPVVCRWSGDGAASAGTPGWRRRRRGGGAGPVDGRRR